MKDQQLQIFGAQCKTHATAEIDGWQKNLGECALRFFSGPGREYLETMELLYKEGPLEPGNLLGGYYHRELVAAGLATGVVVNGSDDFYGLNHLGAMVWKAYAREQANQRVGLGLSRYVCHKEVDAVEISKISRVEGIGQTGYELTLKPAYPVEELPTVVISEEEYQKHKPKVGWWLVVYDSGYRSFSPGPDFVNGYTLKAE